MNSADHLITIERSAKTPCPDSHVDLTWDPPKHKDQTKPQQKPPTKEEWLKKHDKEPKGFEQAIK